MKNLLGSLLNVMGVRKAASGVPEITQDELLAQSAGHALILDVRRPEEYAEGHVPGAINIPHDTIEDRLGEIFDHQDKPVVVYCRSGLRAGKAANVLRENNFGNVQHLQGDIIGWQEAGQPLEK